MAARVRIAIAAGEASGDQLGAGLIRAALALRPDLEFVGIAGPAMREAGCIPWFRTEDLSVMGLAEILRHLPRLLRIKKQFSARVRREPPAAFVGIDAPDFNLRVAAGLRKAGIPAVQYVCPSVWAWRPGRVKVLQRACDRVLCLLPFEVSFLEGSGVPATFVGHPFADQSGTFLSPGKARSGLGLGAGPVIGLLPGSRLSEVALLGEVFLQAAGRISGQFPAAEFVAPMANPGVGRVFREQVAAHAPGLRLRLLDGHAREAIAASDVVLLASGTVTLEAMLIGRPMVVAYRFSPLTYWFARTFRLVRVRHFSLPNLLANESLVPEFLQERVTAAGLADAVTLLLRAPGRRDELQRRFAGISDILRQDASHTAARAVLEVAGLN